MSKKAPAGTIFLFDQSAVPALENFLGHGWTVQEENEFSLAELDINNLVFDVPLKGGENYINGHEKIEREKADTSLIRLQWFVLYLLWKEKGQNALRLIHELYGVSWFEGTGSIIVSPLGNIYFLALDRRRGGRWYWSYCWLDRSRYAGYPSARVRKSLLSPPQ